MKSKYNFGLLKNLKIGFVNTEGKGFVGELLEVKQRNGKYRFIYSENYIEVEENILLNFCIKFKNDTYWFVYSSPKMISGLFLFSMYDTYGFPLEITEEIMEEKGFLCDTEGFYIIKNIQKKRNKNTYKNKNAF